MNIPTSPHILIIDDDRDVRDLVAEYLGNNDMRVSSGASGFDMFEMFDRESIDLVLLDLKLPGEDGMQLARRLRERATVPIVLLTGRNEEADRVMGLELGADDYITKPFDENELRARVRVAERLVRLQSQLAQSNEELRLVLNHIDVSGNLPVCVRCGSIQGEDQRWYSFREVLARENDSRFSFEICPDCQRR